MRHGHDQLAGLRGEQRTADAVASRLPRRHARALGENHHPLAFGEALLALLDHAAHRGAAGAAIDGDGAHQLQAPAQRRHPHELALEHPHLRRQQHHLCKGFPGRGMLHQGDVIAGGQVLLAANPVVEPAAPAQRDQQHARPGPRQHAAAAEREQAADDTEEDGIAGGPQQEPHREQERAEPLHAGQPGRRERSAMRVNNELKVASSASRLLRRRASLSFTITLSKNASMTGRSAASEPSAAV